MGARYLAVLAVLGAVAACGDSAQPGAAGPTPEQQHVWQLANRARADPAAEIRRILAADDRDVDAAIEAFGVDVAVLAADFAAYEPRPPLAWSDGLAAAAERHARDLVATRSQGHRGSDGSSPARRVRDAGVDAQRVVENVLSSATTPFQGHASFLVDWGGGPPTGVQGWPDPGHRMALLAPQRDQPPVDAIGVAWIEMPSSDDDPFGPFVLVQELADVGATFLVGTVWRDGDGDGEYDPGEGIGGATVTVGDGGPTVETWSEGAYQVPLAGIGASVRVVVAAGGETATYEAALSAGTNTLLDVPLDP